jgi:predicted nucleic acid-binding protein
VIVVTNSGPLMALGTLGLLELLSQLYGQVRLPTAGYLEVVVRGSERGSPDAFLTQRAIQRGQLVVVEVSDADLPSDIAALPIDAGEKQALYTLRDQAGLLLLDDLKAREEAQARGLNVRGTLGVIIQAYRAALLNFDEVETMIQTIIARDDIWIAEGLCRVVLAKLRAERTE